MRKGVILEVDHDFVTLLTSEGEFMRTRKREQDYHIGDEINFFPVESDQPSAWQKFFRLSKVRAAVIAAVLLFCTTAILPVYQSNQVYAYMSIDVNPSIELGLNQMLKVVSLIAYNEEGERVLSNLEDWKKEDAAIVAERILDEIEVQGYLEKEKNVLIATANSQGQVETAEQLEETIKEIKEAGKTENLEVMVLSGTAVEREAAKKQGLSMGVYKQKFLPEQEKPAINPPAETKASPPAANPVQGHSGQPSEAPGPKQDNQWKTVPNGKNKPQENGYGNSNNNKGQTETKRAKEDPKGIKNQQRPEQAEKMNSNQEKAANNKSRGNGNGHAKQNNSENGSQKGKADLNSRGKEKTNNNSHGKEQAQKQGGGKSGQNKGSNPGDSGSTNGKD
ncbi:anti-sigma factor domain-containing protein [Bacillus sp. FJAT-27251]|uniref:anti-sigma-I factor RsgI family protein n=1 Tax=Bacillus sp. FJAT-27251 TaxID=1684142 RepID=UPI0006A7E28D|nr:anti-sigma factor domain-containing protein [Bacillus sp. FJAT-27251]